MTVTLHWNINNSAEDADNCQANFFHFIHILMSVPQDLTAYCFYLLFAGWGKKFPHVEVTKTTAMIDRKNSPAAISGLITRVRPPEGPLVEGLGLY